MFEYHQASEFGMFKELAFAASKDCDLSTLSYLLSALMNFKPTSANLATLSSARVADRLPDFVSCSDAGEISFFCCLRRSFSPSIVSGLSHGALQMIEWMKSAEGSC
jgi:hypothetical protein